MDLIANTQLLLARKKQVPLDGTTFTPASKYALYNPAKTNSEGTVVIPPGIWYPIGACLVCSYFALIIVILKSFVLLPIPILLITGIILLNKYLYKPKLTITVNKEGITFRGSEYHWNDYAAAYIFITGSRGFRYLILLQPHGNFVQLSLNGIDNMDLLCTAIRDFQPDIYKNLPTFTP